MPSIVHKNQAFATSGIAVVSSNHQEQSNGLVNVGVQYVVDAVRFVENERRFFLDAPPPLLPKSINLNSLQNRSLFMSSRSISQENGLVYVNAEYAGALVRPTPFISADYETRTYSYDIQSTPLSEWGVETVISGDVRNYGLDNYIIEARLRILTYETCTIGDTATALFPAPDPASLVVNAKYLRKYMPNYPVRTFYPPLNPINFLLKQGHFVTQAEEKVSHVTPTVKIFSVSFIPSAIVPSNLV
jgi:hypothetical protein